MNFFFFIFLLQTFGNEALSHAKWIIPIAVAMSCYGGLNSSIIAASRYETLGNGYWADKSVANS